VTSSVEDVVSAVEARYVADGGSASVTWRYGGRWVGASEGWPKVVAVRATEQYGPLFRGGTSVASGGETRRRITRASAFAWHVYGGSDEATEILLSSLVTVLYRLYGTSNGAIEIVGARWPSQVDETAGDGGAYAILDTVIKFSIPDEVIALPVTGPTDFAHTAAFDGEETDC